MDNSNCPPLGVVLILYMICLACLLYVRHLDLLCYEVVKQLKLGNQKAQNQSIVEDTGKQVRVAILRPQDVLSWRLCAESLDQLASLVELISHWRSAF